jgi:N-acetylglucosaminyldiphosphoundecaprenol N-acetyl-beta-D-mannosaminyltransferase
LETKILKKRINFLGVPVDAIDKESALEYIREIVLHGDGTNHQIVFLTIRKLLRARRDKELQKCLKTASLILPTSLGIIRGARFQKKIMIERFNPFEFVIHLLTVLDDLKQTVYLLGSKKEGLEMIEQNLRTSFPNLRIVGRYTGYFPKESTDNITLAIKKASPTLLLIGKGIKDGDKWILQKRDLFNSSLLLATDNCFQIFSGNEKKVSPKLFKMGLESTTGFFKKPWRFLQLFPYFYFKWLVLLYKILKR